MMTINIAVGTKYSQWTLMCETNKFFKDSKNSIFPSNSISQAHSNYVVNIRKKAIQLILSEKCNDEDYMKLKTYIETLFKGKTIGIFSTEQVPWLRDVKDVDLKQYIEK